MQHTRQKYVIRHTALNTEGIVRIGPSTLLEAELSSTVIKAISFMDLHGPCANGTNDLTGSILLLSASVSIYNDCKLLVHTPVFEITIILAL